MSAVRLRSIEDLHHYTEGLAHRQVLDDPAVQKLQAAKRIAWLVMLSLGFLFYYLIDSMQEALTILG